MNNVLIAGLSLLAAGTTVAAVLKPDFGEDCHVGFERSTAVRIGKDAGENDFIVSCTRTNDCDTAWRTVSRRMRIPNDAEKFTFSFEISSDEDWIKPLVSEDWETAIDWFDGKGERMKRTSLFVEFKAGGFCRFRFGGEVPRGARFATVQWGADRPNVRPGKHVVVRKSELKTLTKGQVLPPDEAPDMTVPLVRAVFKSPSTDPAVKVRYEITDATGVDWESVAVSRTGSGEAVPYVRDGNVLTLTPQGNWEQGDHYVTIEAKDVTGNAVKTKRAFRIGERPQTPAVTLRDDGAVLVDGKPFFPIGIYAVCPREFNGNDFDRAFAGLKAGGFNFAHSYSHPFDPAFLDAAAKYGFKLWTAMHFAADGNRWFESEGRQNPAILAWYLADDTSDNTTPAQLQERDEAVRFLDGTRLTCQADPISSNLSKDRYQDYVRYSDVFMPEIYPVEGSDPRLDERCVAITIRDMKRARSDIEKYGDGKPRAVWPIIQYFKGWTTWKRFPTRKELEAMSFASIIHGAQGITWYTYGGFVDPDKGKFNYGVASSPEVWSNTTNLTTRLSALVPMFLERTRKQPAVPEVLSGPKADPLGQPSVTALVKEHAGCTYVLAVNASPSRVRARLYVAVSDCEGSVAWERRRVKMSRGAFEDDFEGFGVHVYRFAEVGR